MEQDILAVAISKGYSYFANNKFYFRNGLNTASTKKIIEILGIRTDKAWESKLAQFTISILKGDASAESDLRNALMSRAPEVSNAVANTSFRQELDTAFKRQLDNLEFYVVYRPESEALHDKVVAVNRKTRSVITGRAVTTYLSYLKLRYEDIVEVGKPPVYPEFNPTTIDMIMEKEVDGVILGAINTFNPPDWMLKYDKSIASYGGLIRDVIEHLYCVPEERVQVLDWLSRCLVSRNQTVLINAGARGNGKNLIYSQIMGAVMGKHYVDVVGTSVLEEKFNAPMHNKRLVIFDEVAMVSDEASERVKALSNDDIPIEKKGKDPFQAKNFSNLVFNTNQISRIHISPQERRYSVPTLNKTDLKLKIPEIRIRNFIKGLENGDKEVGLEIAKFGWFLMTREITTGDNHQICGHRYMEMVEINYKLWLAKLIEYMGSLNESDYQKPIQMSKIRKLMQRDGIEKPNVPNRIKTLQSEIEDFKYDRTLSLGTVAEVPSAERSDRMALGIYPNIAAIKRIKEIKAERERESKKQIEEYYGNYKENKDTEPSAEDLL